MEQLSGFLRFYLARRYAILKETRRKGQDDGEDTDHRRRRNDRQNIEN